MGIEASLYRWHIDDTGDRYDRVGYIQESYFVSEHYATKILFEGAWSKDERHWKYEPQVLRDRLPAALAEARKRGVDIHRTQDKHINDEYSIGIIYKDSYEELDNLKRFVEQYEQEWGLSDPFVFVFY